jgi:hypothetical protein
MCAALLILHRAIVAVEQATVTADAIYMRSSAQHAQIALGRGFVLVNMANTQRACCCWLLQLLTASAIALLPRHVTAGRCTIH